MTDAGIDPFNMNMDRKKFGVSMATNVETLQNTVNECNNPSNRTKGEFMKMNFMIPASVAMTYGLQGANLITSYACAAGVISIGDSYRLIKHGYMN